MSIPFEQKGRDSLPREATSSDSLLQEIELLKILMDKLHTCANQCKCRIDFIAEIEEEQNETLPYYFAANLGKTLTKIENLLFAYQEHLPLDPYDVWEYIIENQEPENSNYGLNIQDDSITIHIPYLEMPHRKQGGNSLVERLLAALVRKNIDQFPHWHIWQARFFFVFSESTKTKPKDVDNYDYKRIIDLLAFALGSSDNAVHFAMSMETIFTDQIASGIYIEISPRSLENAVLPNW